MTRRTIIVCDRCETEECSGEYAVRLLEGEACRHFDLCKRCFIEFAKQVTDEPELSGA